ncbi:MAG: hypothetical protein IKM43_01155 [Clostridia bacterium]|nr:hypothetical protein [Clostridia bacterium]
MKNLKELKALLSAIHCLNITGQRDKDITLLCEYTFNRIFGGTANLLSLACVGRKKDDIMPEIEQLLKEETKFIEYKESKNG